MHEFFLRICHIWSLHLNRVTDPAWPAVNLFCCVFVLLVCFCMCFIEVSRGGREHASSAARPRSLSQPPPSLDSASSGIQVPNESGAALGVKRDCSHSVLKSQPADSLGTVSMADCHSGNQFYRCNAEMQARNRTKTSRGAHSRSKSLPPSGTIGHAVPLSCSPVRIAHRTSKELDQHPGSSSADEYETPAAFSPHTKLLKSSKRMPVAFGSHFRHHEDTSSVRRPARRRSKSLSATMRPSAARHAALQREVCAYQEMQNSLLYNVFVGQSLC